MSRKQTPVTDEFPLHIVARSNNGDWFQAPLEGCWDIFMKTIDEVHKKFGFETHAFVMMSNHYHWLISTPKFGLAEGMCYFQTTTSRKIARLVNRINRIYGARYKPTVIESPAHYANAYRYILQNPLRAGICKSVTDYPWSTYNDRSVSITVRPEFHEFIPRKNLFDWLNTPPNSDVNEMVRKALRRRVFRFPRDVEKKSPSGLEFL